MIIRYLLAALCVGAAALMGSGGYVDTGIGVAIAGLAIAAGQFMTEALRKSRAERIDDLEATVSKLTKAQERCEANLRAAYGWIKWAQENLVLRSGSAPMMAMPLFLEE